MNFTWKEYWMVHGGGCTAAGRKGHWVARNVSMVRTDGFHVSMACENMISSFVGMQRTPEMGRRCHCVVTLTMLPLTPSS